MTFKMPFTDWQIRLIIWRHYLRCAIMWPTLLAIVICMHPRASWEFIKFHGFQLGKLVEEELGKYFKGMK